MTFEELEEIRNANDLDMYCYIHQIYPFTVLSDRASHNAIQWHMARIDELEEALMDIVDTFDAEHGLAEAIEEARELVMVR